MNYGIGFQGGKGKFAQKIIELLPSATHFYDLFGGGCSLSHAALLSGKFQHVHANDITDSVVLFKDAIEGNLAKYELERFRTREDFEAEKDTNPFVRIVYSFGNDQKSYLYSRQIEDYKRAVHEMIYAPTPNERRLKYREVIRQIERLMNEGVIPPQSSERGGNGKGEALGRIESAERIGQIESIDP